MLIKVNNQMVCTASMHNTIILQYNSICIGLRMNNTLTTSTNPAYGVTNESKNFLNSV